ncbi:MAG: outer membrane lipoprotein carrier protein LolA [Candidatus Binatia bacterium]
MRRACLAAALVAILRSAAPAAPCDSTDACLKVLAAAQAATRTIDARFVQTKHVALLDEPLVTTGRFRFRRPDRVRLDVETPRPTTILIAGRSVTIPGLTETEQQAVAGADGGDVHRARRALRRHARPRPRPLRHRRPRRRRGDRADADADGTGFPTPVPYDHAALRGPRDAGPVDASRRGLGDDLEIEMRDVRRNVEMPDAITAP